MDDLLRQTIYNSKRTPLWKNDLLTYHKIPNVSPGLIDIFKNITKGLHSGASKGTLGYLKSVYQDSEITISK